MKLKLNTSQQRSLKFVEVRLHIFDPLPFIWKLNFGRVILFWLAGGWLGGRLDCLKLKLSKTPTEFELGLGLSLAILT